MVAMMTKIIMTIFLVSISSLEIQAAGAQDGVCWQRKYGYHDHPYAPYPYYRGAFIP